MLFSQYFATIWPQPTTSPLFKRNAKGPAVPRSGHRKYQTPQRDQSRNPQLVPRNSSSARRASSNSTLTRRSAISVETA
jgi:hypothetical protein